MDRKRQKTENRDILLLLPADVCELVVPLLSKRDVVALSCLSHAHRHKYRPYMFDKTRVQWDRIDEFLKTGIKESTQLRLYLSQDLTNSRKAEWNDLNKLARLPNLRTLVLETSSSSIFLKYQQELDKMHIDHLTLESQQCQQFAKFDISHLRVFQSIRTLSLQNFQIYKDMFDFTEYRFDNMTDLSLVNCSWEFPVGIHLVFPCKLLRLAIHLDDAHSKFTLSERFTDFLKFKHAYYDSLRDLEICVDGQYRPSCNWLSVPATLTSLTLRGWKLNSIADLNTFQDSNLEKLTIGFANDVDAERCYAKLHSVLPNTRIRLV